MPVGRTISKAEVDNAVGGIAASLFATLDNVKKVKAVLDGYSSAQMVSALGYATTGDADIVKSALADMDTLRQVWEGTAAKSPAADMRVFAKQLLGTGLY
jgi:hypothetical protein